MRKTILLLAATAALILTACNKDSAGGQDYLPPAPMAEYAKKLTVTDKGSPYASVEFTEAGKYILATTKEHSLKSGDTGYEYTTGNYAFQGGVYILLGFGTVTLSGDNITFAPHDGQPLTLSVIVGPQAPESEFNNTIARTWKVNNVRISVNNGGTAVSLTKKGCDIYEILTELKSRGVPVYTEGWQGFTVSDIVLTQSGTFMVEFTGEAPLVGTYKTGSDGTFNYDISGYYDGQQITGVAIGQVAVDNGRLILQVNLDLQNGNNAVTVNTVLYLSEP